MTHTDTLEHQEALLPGVLLRDYSIERVLGQGGFGITYLAHDTVFDRPVAIKEFLPVDIARRFGDARVGPRTTQFREAFEWGLSEFLEEAKLIDRLDHPNVVRVRSFFRDNETAYLVMEYVEGPTLSVWLQEHAPESAELIALLQSLVAGLGYMHSRECLHRDIKPDNIILRGGRIDAPVLIDFGAARKAVAERTRSIAAIVSAGYTPLEQYSSHRTLTPAMDLYALCAVAYRCITGEDPPPATERAIADEMPKLTELAAGRFPQELLAAVDAGLALRVTDRSPDLQALASALNIEPLTPSSGAQSAATVASTPVVGISARGAEQDRGRRTMQVDYTNELATPEAARPNVVAASAGGLAYPKPILLWALALAIGMGVYARFVHESYALEALTQTAFALPFAAFVGSWAAHRWFQPADSGVRGRALQFVIAYLTVMFIAIVLYAAIGRLYAQAQYAAVDGALQAAVKSEEFAYLGVGMALLYWFAPRLRPLSDVGRQSARPGIVVFAALLLAALGLSTFHLFDTTRTAHIQEDLPLQLRRAGYLQGDDEAAEQAAIRAVEAQGIASDPNHRAVYEWVRNGATRTAYRVAPDGTGDFTTITAALEQASHMSLLGTPIEIRVTAGTYREALQVNGAVQLLAEGKVVLEQAEGAPAIRFTSTIGSGPKGAWLKGFTVRAAHGGPSPVTVAEGFRVRLEGNTFEAADPSLYGEEPLVSIGARATVRPYSLPDAPVEVIGNRFSGVNGIVLNGHAVAHIAHNDFIGLLALTLGAWGHAKATLEDNVFSPGYGLETHESATVTLRGGALRSSFFILKAFDSTSVTLEDIEVGTGHDCAMAADKAQVVFRRVKLNCAGVLAFGDAKATLVDSLFAWRADLGSDVSSYVNNGDRKNVTLWNTRVLAP